MAPQFWIGAQIFLDMIMVALLLWFLRSLSRRQASWNEHQAAIQKAEIILVEMREISRTLEENLQQKKELSNRILIRMDQEMKKAEECYGRISAVLPELCAVRSFPSDSKDSEKTRASVYELLEKGLSKEEISRHLGISLGEIELIMKLRPLSRGR